MTRKQLTSLLLLSAMLATVSCGGETPTGDDTTPANDSETTPVVEGYDYQGKDFGEYEFNVVNLDTQYGSYIRFDFEEQSGEQLDDAVYDRNRKVEDILNINLNEIIIPRGAEWQTGQAAICEAIMQQVMADDDDYDAGFLPAFYKRDVLADNYLLNIADIPEMNVYEEYWDASINEEMTVNGNLLVAAGPLNMMTLDTSWILLFNEDMMSDYKMEFPYQLVRDGKWTLDKFYEYTSAAASLNGDESFRYTEGGNAVYGLVAHTALPAKLLYPAGVSPYERSADGEITLTFGSERLYTALEKINSVMSITDGVAYFNNGGVDTLEGYMGMFVNNRGLFIGCQLKEAVAFRVMESTFGLLPLPKMEESQEKYITPSGTMSQFLAIPTTQDDPSRAGFILDALTYESYQSVLPVFMDVTVSQKGLRNDDSIEMLQYVWDGRIMDLLQYYNVDTVSATLGNLISGGSGIGTAASVVASNMAAMEQKFAEFLEQMGVE